MSAFRTIRVSWRSLRRTPVFSGTIVLTLTVGIGAAAAIFTVLNAVMFRPLPYANPDRLVGVWHRMTKIDSKRWNMTSGMYLTYAELTHSLESIAAYVDGAASVTDPKSGAEPERVTTAMTTANLFHTLGAAPLLGRTYSAAEDVPRGPDVVVISEGLWRSRFASDPNVVGRTIVVSGRNMEIIGVMPERFRFPSADTKLWMPSQIDPNVPYPGSFRYRAVARLAAGASLAGAQLELASVLPRLVERFPNHAPGFTTRMMLDQAQPRPILAPMRDDLVGDSAQALWIVAATAVLVLLVTCANVTNLLLIRGDGRHREITLRYALGASRMRVIAQFFSESALLAGIASLFAIAGTVIGIALLVRAGPAEIPRLQEIHVDVVTIVFTVVVTLVVAFACSFVPAMRFLRGNALATLRGGGRGETANGRQQRTRSVLVAAQMAFALVALAASGLLFRSFQRLHAVRPGFDARNVTTLWLSLPPARYPTAASVVRFYSDLVQRATHLPGVTSVGIASAVPLADAGRKSNGFYVEGDATYAKSIPPLQFYTKTDGAYFKTMGIPIIAGRTFGAIDAVQPSDEAVISQHAATQFFHDSTGRAALGKRFKAMPRGEWHTIVGVVGSVHDTSLSAPVTGAVYLPEALTVDTGRALPAGLALSPTMALVARTNIDPSIAARSLQALVRDLDPTLPTFDVRPMRATIERSIARLSFTMMILGVAAGVTLVLGIVGLYGVMAYVVTLRTREIGVRIALGAQPREVMTTVARQGLTLSLWGVAAGIALSLVTARFLRVFLFEVAPSDPITLGVASTILVVLATLASWIPARRAARIDPVSSLRAG